DGRRRPDLLVDVCATRGRQGEKTADLREDRYPPSGGQNINFSLHAPIPCGHETLDSMRPPTQPERSSDERSLAAHFVSSDFAGCEKSYPLIGHLLLLDWPDPNVDIVGLNQPNARGVAH